MMARYFFIVNESGHERMNETCRIHARAAAHTMMTRDARVIDKRVTGEESVDESMN